MTTLEKILSLVSSGFSFKKEITTTTLKPAHSEWVEEELGAGSYTSEGGAYIEATPNSYYGCREYHKLTGEYLFTESLPLEERYKYYPGCSQCGGYRFSHYAIAKSAKPVTPELELVHTKRSGKMFWLPWSLRLTHMKIPSEMKIYIRPERYLLKGRIFFGVGIK